MFVVVFSTPTDCSKYYTCSAKTNGLFYQSRFKCPDATHYDLRTESCRPKDLVDCRNMSIVEILNTYEYYRQQRQMCQMLFTDDKSIENCLKIILNQTKITTMNTNASTESSEFSTMIPTSTAPTTSIALNSDQTTETKYTTNDSPNAKPSTMPPYNTETDEVEQIVTSTIANDAIKLRDDVGTTSGIQTESPANPNSTEKSPKSIKNDPIDSTRTTESLGQSIENFTNFVPKSITDTIKSIEESMANGMKDVSNSVSTFVSDKMESISSYMPYSTEPMDFEATTPNILSPESTENANMDSTTAAAATPSLSPNELSTISSSPNLLQSTETSGDVEFTSSTSEINIPLIESASPSQSSADDNRLENQTLMDINLETSAESGIKSAESAFDVKEYTSLVAEQTSASIMDDGLLSSSANVTDDFVSSESTTLANRIENTTNAFENTTPDEKSKDDEVTSNDWPLDKKSKETAQPFDVLLDPSSISLEKSVTGTSSESKKIPSQILNILSSTSSSTGLEGTTLSNVPSDLSYPQNDSPSNLNRNETLQPSLDGTTESIRSTKIEQTESTSTEFHQVNIESSTAFTTQMTSSDTDNLNANNSNVEENFSSTESTEESIDYTTTSNIGLIDPAIISSNDEFLPKPEENGLEIQHQTANSNQTTGTSTTTTLKPEASTNTMTSTLMADESASTTTAERNGIIENVTKPNLDLISTEKVQRTPAKGYLPEISQQNDLVVGNTPQSESLISSKSMEQGLNPTSTSNFESSTPYTTVSITESIHASDSDATTNESTTIPVGTSEESTDEIQTTTEPEETSMELLDESATLHERKSLRTTVPPTISANINSDDSITATSTELSVATSSDSVPTATKNENVDVSTSIVGDVSTSIGGDVTTNQSGSSDDALEKTTAFQVATSQDDSLISTTSAPNGESKPNYNYATEKDPIVSSMLENMNKEPIPTQKPVDKPTQSSTERFEDSNAHIQNEPLNPTTAPSNQNSQTLNSAIEDEKTFSPFDSTVTTEMVSLSTATVAAVENVAATENVKNANQDVKSISAYEQNESVLGQSNNNESEVGEAMDSTAGEQTTTSTSFTTKISTPSSFDKVNEGTFEISTPSSSMNPETSDIGANMKMADEPSTERANTANMAIENLVKEKIAPPQSSTSKNVIAENIHPERTTQDDFVTKSSIMESITRDSSPAVKTAPESTTQDDFVTEKSAAEVAVTKEASPDNSDVESNAQDDSVAEKTTLRIAPLETTTFENIVTKEAAITENVAFEKAESAEIASENEYPLSTESNEKTEDPLLASTEITTIPSEKLKGTTQMELSTEVSTINSGNAQAIAELQTLNTNNSYIDVELENISGNGVPTLSLNVKRSIYLKLNITIPKDDALQ